MKHGYVVRKVGFDGRRRGVMKPSKVVLHNLILFFVRFFKVNMYIYRVTPNICFKIIFIHKYVG